jgi:hypothetical protein
MKKILFVPATIVALLFAFNAAIASAADKKGGDESKARSVEEKMDNLVKLAGVQNVKTDDTGRVLRLVVIGHARMSNIFGAAKGKEMARKNAMRDAKAQFVSWLGTQAEVHESKEGGEAIFLVADKDAEKRSETGKAIETSSDTFKSVAAGLVRGLEVVHADLNPDGEEFTVICGWKAANSKAAKDVATNDPGIDDKSAAGADTKKESGSAEPKKKHHREKATSSNAEDYLK